MSSKTLKNKPLVEAILEVRWRLAEGQTTATGQLPAVDAPNRLFAGRFYDRISDSYPFPESLPSAAIPEEMAANVAQYRFRSKESGWPLVQIGPGILTLNDTDSYEWGDFEKRSQWVLAKLLESSPSPKEPKIESLLLRYIDSVKVDFAKEDITSFLRDKLKVEVRYPDSLFENTQVRPDPVGFVLQSSFRSEAPKGIVQVKFSKGLVKEQEALIWETLVMSAAHDLPRLPEEFAAWLSAAHEITDNWFFKLIDGELLRQFD